MEDGSEHLRVTPDSSGFTFLLFPFLLAWIYPCCLSSLNSEPGLPVPQQCWHLCLAFQLLSIQSSLLAEAHQRIQQIPSECWVHFSVVPFIPQALGQLTFYSTSFFTSGTLKMFQENSKCSQSLPSPWPLGHISETH